MSPQQDDPAGEEHPDRDAEPPVPPTPPAASDQPTDGPRIGFRRNEEPDPRPTGADPGAGDNPLNDLLAALAGGELPAGLADALPGMLNLPPGAAGMPTDAAGMQHLFASLQQLLTGSGSGPVNWELAEQVARQSSMLGGDPTPGDAHHRQVADALRTADVWLDQTSALPSATSRTEAWSRAEWIEHTLPVWRQVVEPIAERVAQAMTDALQRQSPPQVQAMLGGAAPMMRTMAGAFFGAQVGQALGALAQEVVGGGDVGIPLLPPGRSALLPTNLTELGTGLGLPQDEVRLYLALREAAHVRLFAGVHWLRAHVLALVDEYARGIVIDTDRIEEAVRGIDPTDPAALQEALASDLFLPNHTPAQQGALDRLELALALVEGWVDEVVDGAAGQRLPHADALRETLRRRRASGGPAERTFASLVGLELRPRRLREAAQVWAALGQARGIAARDELWSHPDVLPGPEAFADPVAFATIDRSAPDDLDAELARLLDDEPPTSEATS